jgi:hypothetical protein
LPVTTVTNFQHHQHCKKIHRPVQNPDTHKLTIILPLPGKPRFMLEISGLQANTGISSHLA